jgi:threonine dehydrogenase-like Zn-dependent dehydrogenase
MISLALLALFVVVTFALWREGLWSSAIMFLNVLAAATFATAWFEWAVALLASGRVDVSPLLTATLPMADAAEAFRLASDRSRAMKVQLAFA